jgi:hypothetical protein
MSDTPKRKRCNYMKCRRLVSKRNPQYGKCDACLRMLARFIFGVSI